MPSTLGIITSQLAQEIFEGTISVADITTRKMPHRTQVDAGEGECVHLFQGILIQLLKTLRNAAIRLTERWQLRFRRGKISLMPLDNAIRRTLEVILPQVLPLQGHRGVVDVARTNSCRPGNM